MVVDDEHGGKDEDLQELIICMEKTIEKMKRRQEMMDGKLDRLIAQLNSTNGGCDVSVKKEESDEKFIVSCLGKCSLHSFSTTLI